MLKIPKEIKISLIGILATIVAGVLMYLFGWFVSLEANVTKWDAFGRFASVLCSVPLAMVVFIWFMSIYNSLSKGN